MSLFSRSWKPVFSRAWKPIVFPSGSVVPILGDTKIEEETLPDYVASRYYPVHIGEIFIDRYQVVGKLGFGVTSTVWLARDLSECRHVALKLCVDSNPKRSERETELNVYKRIEKSSKDHPGRNAVRFLLDSFDVNGPHGRHRHRNPLQRLPEPVMAFVLKRLFLALDLLHREKLREPSPRKEVDGRIIYLPRELSTPKDVGAPVPCDFGSAVPLDDGSKHTEDIQPNVYRAHETILDIPWTYSVDIWNVGCMVWDAFEGEHLFTGQDQELETYRGRAHLEPPPPSLLARANLRSKFFSATSALGSPPLEHREKFLDGEGRECFLRFMRKLLQWEPEKRSSAKELAGDKWILKHTN
ncbi:kinase-like protein [Plenodomus tracheiphilus IPT5]|uniref:Kinase-like protein n=1 Tax=Plenodomus tracheiphilus IPT5 TaxID=1408161 RepID=A0A6A7B058_9PLEO|nr:kinase-like protein [Plenodomus tracheiphilus IPT5]